MEMPKEDRQSFGRAKMSTKRGLVDPQMSEWIPRPGRSVVEKCWVWSRILMCAQMPGLCQVGGKVGERGGLWKHKLRFPILFDFQGTFASPPTMTNRIAWLCCVPERGGGDWLGLWIQVEPFRYVFDNHNVVVVVGQHCRERRIYEFTGQCLFKKIKMSYTR